MSLSISSSLISSVHDWQISFFMIFESWSRLLFAMPQSFCSRRELMKLWRAFPTKFLGYPQIRGKRFWGRQADKAERIWGMASVESPLYEFSDLHKGSWYSRVSSVPFSFRLSFSLSFRSKALTDKVFIMIRNAIISLISAWPGMEYFQSWLHALTRLSSLQSCSPRLFEISVA